MKVKNIKINYYKIWIVAIAIIIIVGVLFVKPEIGVADQGDFDRIMSISGLTLLDSDESNPNFVRFYNYIVTEYRINEIDKITKTIKGCSLSYLIVVASKICGLFGKNTFKTIYLAAMYSILYVLAFIIILKSLNIKNKSKLFIISVLLIFMFFDGNYLVWFNSLYGEPMMIVTFSLFLAAVLNYIHYKYVVRGTKKLFVRITFILFSAYLFIGSKLQVITALPFIIFLIVKIIYDNRQFLNKMSLASLCIGVYVLVIYPIGICNNSNNLCKDTEYNSVFYGILNGSETPKQDLIDLGLNPDMYVEAGKHSYLPSDEYEKYIPGTEITNNEFYSKINNKKLAKFYLTHPLRLLKGMEYTSGKAFQTSTLLGKCSQSYSEVAVRQLNRFTIWSRLRERILPKNLFFIIVTYLIIIRYSINRYIRNKENLEIRNKMLLLWITMLIGAAQFLMPFVGNGRADTAKQLFLFNFIFDGLLLLTFYYSFLKIIHLFKKKTKSEI